MSDSHAYDYFAEHPPSPFQESDGLDRKKIDNIGQANRKVIGVINELENINALLKAARADLAASDKSLIERTGQLKSARADLAASDKSLIEANDQLVTLVKELALANEKLLEANEQISNSEKMQKEFINIAAHELRTPITPILVSLYLAQRVKTASGASQIILTEDQAEMIVRNSRRLEKLAKDILAVARIEGKALELHKETMDLNEEVVHEISDIKTSVPSDKSINFIFEPSTKPILVNVDKSKIHEVISNLLENAIRFMDMPQGKIAVRLSREKRDDMADKNSSGDMMATVTINDNGRGIDPQILPRIFQKFVASPHSGGTGLGLYVSKSILEAHGGKIQAENNKDGKGATFRFSLPLAS